MHRSSVSRKALTKFQSGVVAAVIMVAFVLGLVYYLSLPAPASNLPPATDGLGRRLLVGGLVQRPLNLSLEEIMTMPRSTVNAELYCLPSANAQTGVLVDSGDWTGVKLGFILEEAGVSPDAVKVAFFADDGFTTDLTIAKARGEDVILVYEKNGEPLPEELRLVVPGMWGYKWIKWLIRIEVVDYDFKGTYESGGFPDNAEIP